MLLVATLTKSPEKSAGSSDAGDLVFNLPTRYHIEGKRPRIGFRIRHGIVVDPYIIMTRRLVASSIAAFAPRLLPASTITSVSSTVLNDTKIILKV